MLNTVAVSGVLGYPLELKKDKNGKSYIRSSVSVSRNYKGEDGYYLKKKRNLRQRQDMITINM